MARDTRNSRTSRRGRGEASYDGASRARVEEMGISDRGYTVRTRTIMGLFVAVAIAIVVRLVILQVVQAPQ